MMLNTPACCFILFFAIALGGNVPSKKSKSLSCKVPNETQCLYNEKIISIEESTHLCRSTNTSFIIRGVSLNRRCYCEWNILGRLDTNFFYPLETCEKFHAESLLASQEAAANRAISGALARASANGPSRKQQMTDEYVAMANEVDLDISCHDQCMNSGRRSGKSIITGINLGYNNQVDCYCQYQNWGCTLHEELSRV